MSIRIIYYFPLIFTKTNYSRSNFIEAYPFIVEGRIRIRTFQGLEPDSVLQKTWICIHGAMDLFFNVAKKYVYIFFSCFFSNQYFLSINIERYLCSKMGFVGRFFSDPDSVEGSAPDPVNL